MKKPTFKVASFGRTKYGEKARKFTLNGADGVVMEVGDYGGKIIKLFTPDRNGKMRDVVVGFDSPVGWDNGDPYWGCIIGRYGNRIAKGAFTPTDKGQIPTGKVVPAAKTPFDFRKGMRIGEKINEKNTDLEIGRGYAHNWVLEKRKKEKGKSNKCGGMVVSSSVEYAGEVSYPGNGRKVEVWTTEPRLQVYTANWADYNQTAKGEVRLSFRCGVALETQHVPDSPNKSQWPTTIVKAGQLYRSTTEFRFGVVRLRSRPLRRRHLRDVATCDLGDGFAENEYSRIRM